MTQRKKPLPVPTPDTLPFWEGCKRHELIIQHCQECKQFYFYPRPFCPHCGSSNVSWEKVSGRGTLYSYVINYRPAPGFEEDAPYIIAVVELNEGPRMMTNLVGLEPDPEKIQLDMAVEVAFEDVTAEITLPKFRPA